MGVIPIKGIEPGEASSTVTDHDSYIEVRKHLSMGLGTLTLKDQQISMMLIGIDMVLVLVPNS